MSNEEKIFKNKHFTMIPSIFVKEVDGDDCILNNKQLTIAVAIYMTRTTKDVCIFNINHICKTLNIKYTTRFKKNIVDTLEILQEEDQIYFRDSIYCDDKYHINELNKIKLNDNIYGELINHMDGDFTVICDKDVQKIIEYSTNNNIDIFSIIKHYIYICSCINKDETNEDYLCAYPQLTTISQVCNIKSKETIIKYNKIFRDLKIFSFDYAGYKIDKNGAIRNGKMFYTTYGNEEILLDRLRVEREKFGYYKISDKYKELKNIQRSISKKIDNINKLKEKTIIDLEKIKLLEKEKQKIINLAEKER
ncbi:DUF677 domain-containing protein [Clostridium sp. VAP52]|uniref:DUF677 domain-containing protein n=1 Tax=Clostridium sp. VAP52 TaxID=2949977 RepID=UPI002079865F|nr:DUF677 domain-containing protein [Clostridium sp. VAP52]